MHELILRLSEAQIVEVVLLLEENKLDQARTLLQQQLKIDAETADHLLLEFARQHDIALEKPHACSNSPNIKTLDLADITQHPEINTGQAGLIKQTRSHLSTTKTKPNRIVIGLAILILVIVLGLIFG